MSHLCGRNGGIKRLITNCTNRKDEVIINRLRIGHTRLTHSFRMENRPHPPLCDQCEGDHELTVKHILIECDFLKIIRRRHYDVTDLNQLFKTVSSKRKDALSKAQPENFDIPCTDVFMKIQPFISSLWQERWDKEVGNKLHAIMPQIDDKYYLGCRNRTDEVIINRLRIGHTRLTHSFRMENRPHPPLCDQCEGDHELTVKHILIECNFLKIIRRRHYDVTDLNQLFKTVSSKRILDFVKDIGLYNSL